MPLPVLNLEQMRQWEKATWATGQTEAEVIRRVGLMIARQVLRLTRSSDLILILAGKGHNGDDARCAREHLPDRRVDVLEVADPEKDLPRLKALLSLKPALIVDGLFGIGLNRPLSPDWIKLIDSVNQTAARVLAVDVPSGFDVAGGQAQGTAMRATVTLTVGAPKIGLLSSSAWPYVGRLEVADNVGLAPDLPQTELQWTVPEDFFGFPPARGVAGHKGTYGHLSIVAGSRGYHGAAVLAAGGAQRAQPGLITLHTLESIYPVVASKLQAVMVAPWSSQNDPAKNRTGVVVGPGLAGSEVPEGIRSLVGELWQQFPGPMLVDASALAWVPSDKQTPAGVRILTPHPGEASRMLDCETKEVQEDRLEALRKLSNRFGNAFVVLKGHQTIVGRQEGPVFVNCSGNPHLAQGGSGDVLSGYLGGLLAQPSLQADPLLTLRYGVWQHGTAADYLQQTKSNCVVEDLVKQLGLGI